MATTETFNAREAALRHAALAESAGSDLLRAAMSEDEAAAIGALGAAYADGVHAIACGLVYVGDQIRASVASLESVAAAVDGVSRDG